MTTKGACVDCEDATSASTSPRCRKCWKELQAQKAVHDYRRNWNYKKKYNLDLDGFEVLWQAFRGRCGICDCLLKPTQSGRGQPLQSVSIDHNHVTGNIRGLLCSKCNRGLGFFDDNPELLKKALEWVCNE